MMRAVGSRISADGQEVTVFLSRPHSRQLLQDIAATGHLAVVFSQPSTHRTIQLKATRVALRNATPEDAADMQRCETSLDEELQAIGYQAGLAGILLEHRLEEVVAVSFRPEQAYDQTPGPKAGARIGGPQ
jgi:GTP cyclohydrolase II